MHTDPNTPDAPIVIDDVDAKAGTKGGHVRWVLIISLALAAIAMTVIWLTGALSQDPVESQMNVERRIEAQAEQAADDGSSIDGVTSDAAPTAAAQ